MDRFRVSRWCLTAGLALSAVLVSAAAAIAAQTIPLSFNETVRQADAIVQGRITAMRSRWGDSSRRWMVTDYSLAVEEVLHGSEKGEAIGAAIVLTYWGGTIDGETQGVSDVRLPAIGERVVVMLRPDWARAVSFTPVVGFNQGLFGVVDDAASGITTVRDANGQPLALAAGRVQLRQTATAAAPGVSLETLTSWLRDNIASIKAAPPERPAPSGAVDAELLRAFSKTPAAARAGGRPAPGAEPTRAPAGTTSAEGDAGVPVPPASAPLELSGPGRGVPQGGRGGVTQYVTLGPKPNVPIIVNNFPASFTPWAPEDQFQMSKWNYYATEVFRVYATPTTTYGWPDNIFDLDGFPSSANLQSVYGSAWQSNVIGVTFYRHNGVTILEADIALNPAFSFTLNDQSILDGGGAQGFRLTMLHELGHMHGLDHAFTEMAVMNYFPSVYRSFGLPYADDAEAIRVEYPAKAVSRTDLGVYLYRPTGSQSISDATYPVSVTAGGTLTVSNYWVENVGTATIATPTIEWYLTAARNYTSPYYFVGQATHSSLARFTHFTPSSVTRTFPVPAGVPPGFYYLGAFIRDDAGYTQSSFPFSNNYAFSRLTIRVDAAPPVAPAITASPSSATRNAGQSVTFTAAASGSPTPAVQWQVSSGAAFTNISGATATAYTFTTAMSDNGRSYRAVFTNAAGSATTAAATLTVLTLAPVVTLNPVGGTVSTGQAIFFSSTASGAPAPAPQWQVSVNSGASWSNIAGATGPNLSFGAQRADHGKWYRCVYTNTAGTAATNAAVLLVRPRVRANLDGDRKSNLALWTPATGTWSWLMSGAGYGGTPVQRQWGNLSLGDVPLSGDLDGDGRMDLVVWRASSGTWFWLTSSSNYDLAASQAKQWGNLSLGDKPLLGDVDGDGKADLIVWRASEGSFYWLTSSSGYSHAAGQGKQWGNQSLGDKPLLGDFDGDGKVELTVWRASEGAFYWLTSSSGYDYAAAVGKQWGNNGLGDQPLVADMDGDDVDDLIVWRASDGSFYWLTSSSGYSYAAAQGKQWGSQSQGDIPLLGDFDGDSRADLVVWRPNNGIWFWLTSSTGYSYAAQQAKQRGASGDVPMLK